MIRKVIAIIIDNHSHSLNRDLVKARFSVLPIILLP